MRSAIASSPLAAALRAGGFVGQIVERGDPGYDDARAGFNGAIDRRPAAVAYASDDDDVAAAIRAVRAAGLPCTIRSGGHSVSGVLAPLRASCPPAFDGVGLMPYVALQSMLDDTAPRGWRYYDRMHYFDTVGDELIDALLAGFERVPAPQTHVVTGWMGGAIDRTALGATAFNALDAGRPIRDAYSDAVWERLVARQAPLRPRRLLRGQRHLVGAVQRRPACSAVLRERRRSANVNCGIEGVGSGGAANVEHCGNPGGRSTFCSA